MALPDAYTLKIGGIPAYFDAMLDAQPPERFSAKFLEQLGFDSANDRLFVGILKELGFLDADGAPTERYFSFLDRSRSKQIVADGIRDAYADLFAVNTKANELSVADVKNKLRTLYAGKKTDLVISNISKTFSALCEYADFSSPSISTPKREIPDKSIGDETGKKDLPPKKFQHNEGFDRLSVRALEYHINIVLPETRDQAVFDAIFKSLREHLG
ncbi:MAG: DUF5343 domain-containing protein [Pirellulaceae bacterium]|nr:DUF5343 domain-containing protein [Pirellulaceae bacterium]